MNPQEATAFDCPDPPEIFICAFDGPWHVGEKKELRTPSGELLHRFVVAACSHKQIGGPWGHRTWRHAHRPHPREMCKRCQRKFPS